MVKTLIDQIFEDIVETIREPLLVLDSDLKVVLANQSFYDSFKVKPEETVGQLIYDIGNKQWDIPKLRELLEKILPEKSAFDNYEVEHDFATIGRRTMLLNARQIEQAIGKERIILLAIEDITARRQSETLLKNSEERYRRIFETADDGILLLEKSKMKIRHANSAIMAMLGYSNEELIGKDMNDIGFPDDIGTFQEIMQVLNKDGILHCKDVAVQNKAGQVIHTDIYMADRANLVQCNICDITERKEAEEFLRESKEKFHSIVDNIGIGVALISPTMEILELNRQMREWFPDIDLSKRLICHRALNNPPREEICDYCPTCKTFQDGNVHEAATITPTPGGPRNHRIVSSPIFDANGEVKAVIRMVDDLTERISLETQLLQAQKMEAIGNLAGGIAHDFNNILTSVIGFTELSLDEVEKGTHIEDNLQEIYTAGKRAKDLVRQILAFARQPEEELKPIQVDKIAAEVLKFIRSSIPATIEIKQTIESDSLIMGNATQVYQILMNLFTNAAHAMEDKGGILEFSLKDVVMDRGVTREALDLKPGNYIEIKVSDTGTGIASEIIGAIFDPYFTTKGPGEGTGMGLAMVHGIVESYGGKISVDSKPGQGALFRIYFPVTRKRQEHRPYQSEELPIGTERILLVDDEAPVVKMGRQALERLGYTVSIRTGSIEALELFRSKPNDFDLVITDMTMPNMTGDKLAVELMKIRPGIPVMLCTGFSKKISDDSATAIGIKAFAYKPIVKSDLAKTVRKVLDNQQKEQITGRILVIDDESGFRKLFIQKLAGKGYEIIEACDGKEGLKLYHETRPDLVITDLVMPEKEGIETITELKREFPNVKIIAVSGGGRNVPDAYLNIAKSLGAERIFHKPIDWPEMIKAVRELLK